MSETFFLEQPTSQPYLPASQANKPEDDQAFLLAHPWIRHYEQGVPAHVTVPDYPLTWLLDQAMRTYPQHTALMYYGTRLTYNQLVNAANRFATGLKHLGVKRGDRIALMLPNIPQYPIAFYGALKAGAVVVPTNPLYTKRELQYQLGDADVRILVVLDTLFPLVQTIRGQTALEQIILTSAADFLPPLLRTIYRLGQFRHTPIKVHHADLDPTIWQMQDMLEPYGEDIQEDCVVPTTNDLAVLQYTGGTTGFSKGAMLTHHNLLTNALQVRAWFPSILPGEESILCVAPFFHAYGMTAGMNIALLMGATMILLPRFRAKDVAKAIRRYHPTLFPGIPTMYFALLHEASKHAEEFASIKYCISGAAPLSAKVQADFEAITHCRLVEGYGLTEAGPVTHANPLTDACRNGSIGLPFPDIDAAIVEQGTEKPLPYGEVGELVLKGPNIMQGYWQHEEETKIALHGGWLHTGDLGKMDEDGYFYIVERAKDVIIASGFKIFPREVEEILLQHPFVSEAAVAGVPDVYRGETVAAYIVLKPDVTADEHTRLELIRFCQRELTPYKVPHILEFRHHLPKSLIGKVMRRKLQSGQ